MAGTTGWENGVVIAKNINFDYTASPPRTGLFTANGQLLIGSTTNPDVCAVASTLTAGTGISITNGPGSITITATGGGGSGASSFVTDVPGPIAPTGAGAVTVTGSNVYTDGGTANTIKYNLQGTAHTIYVNQGLLTPATTIGPLTNGQLIIGSTGVDPVAATLASSDSSITITNGGGAIDLKVAGGTTSGKTITGDSGGALAPTAGNWNIIGGTVAAGTSPLKTAGAGSTLTINAQKSQAIAAADATKIGLANFNSGQFSVDANGFVSLVSSSNPPTLAFDVQANTAPGTDPVLATALGVVTVNGAAVAAHSVPIETRSRAANAFNIEIQEAAAVAASDATKSGICHFNSANFSVDANGFVTASGVASTITGDSGGALSPTAGNWNVLGRSGSKTSGSGSTITVKSPPYSDQGGSATVTLNSGSFVTAAITLTLPASAGLADGDVFEFVCTTASPLIIQAVGTQKIRMGSLLSSAAGTITSTAIGDSVSLRFRSTDQVFYRMYQDGTWIIA